MNGHADCFNLLREEMGEDRDAWKKHALVGVVCALRHGDDAEVKRDDSVLFRVKNWPCSAPFDYIDQLALHVSGVDLLRYHCSELEKIDSLSEHLSMTLPIAEVYSMDKGEYAFAMAPHALPKQD